MDPAHERILGLAAEERRLRNSSAWKCDMDAAFEAHGDACDRLYDELYRQLDAMNGKKIAPLPSERNIRKQVRREILSTLKGALPDMISTILDEKEMEG